MDSSPSGWSGLGVPIAEKPLAAWTCCHGSQDIGLRYHAGVLRIQRLPRPSGGAGDLSNPVPYKIVSGTDSRGNG